MTAAAKRLLLETLGWVLLVVGIAALFLPGPGLLLIFFSLILLSTQYVWARRLTEPVRVHAWYAAAEGVQTWPRITLSALAALCVAAVGVVWLWHPPAPSWWPVAEEWWLFGGPGMGYVFIGSAVLALGLLAFSVRRFYHHPLAVDEVMRMRSAYAQRVALRKQAHRRLNRMTGRRDRFWHGHL